MQHAEEEKRWQAAKGEAEEIKLSELALEQQRRPLLEQQRVAPVPTVIPPERTAIDAAAAATAVEDSYVNSLWLMHTAQQCEQWRDFAARLRQVTAKSAFVTVCSSLIVRFRDVITQGRIKYFRWRRLGNASQDVFFGEWQPRRGKKKKCAVKKIKVSEFSDDFLREVEVLQELSHENVLRMFDSSEATNEGDTFCYLALELCHGSLEDLIAGGAAFDPIDVCRQTVAGIAYLHTRTPCSVVHRDIKPSNILCSCGSGSSSGGGSNSSNLQIKVADFGIAKEIDVNRTSNTMTVMGAGTMGFMAAEIVDLRVGDAEDNWRPTLNELKSADIFALGCVLFFVFTRGSHPFHNPRRNKINFHSCDVQIWERNPPLMLGSKQLDPELVHLVRQMVVHEPAANRPNILSVSDHPLFFTPTRRIVYLDNLWLQQQDEVESVLSSRNNDWRLSLRNVWEEGELGAMLDPSDGVVRRYRATLSELVRWARNLRQHFRNYGPGHRVYEALVQARLLADSCGGGGGGDGGNGDDSGGTEVSDEDIARLLKQAQPDLWVVLKDGLRGSI